VFKLKVIQNQLATNEENKNPRSVEMPRPATATVLQLMLPAPAGSRVAAAGKAERP